MNPLIQSYLLQPVQVLEVISALFAVFGCCLLYANERFRGLCLLLALNAVLMVFNFSEETGFFKQNHLVTPIFTLATGPAFLMFVRHLVDARHEWHAKQLVHLIPALLALPFTHFTAAVIAIGSISLVIYGVLGLRLLLRYQRESFQWSSAAVDMQLAWLTRLVLIFAALGLTDLVRINLQPVLAYQVMNTWYFLHQLCVFLLYVCLIFFAVRQPELFDRFGASSVPSQTLDNHDIEQSIFTAIDRQVREEQLFSQPRLSLDDVARAMGLGIKDVSSAINSVTQQSFCHYINSLRVDAVKRALVDSLGNKNQARNVLGLALDCGFNSKSSFNTIFKQSTGMTPSAYLKQKSSES